MQPTPDARTSPILQIFDDLVSAELHAAAWARCSGAGWFFGNTSNNGDGSAFWKMNLESDPAFDAIWEQVRPRCEELAGTPLRVRRQYANGHTYGLGGRPHRDDGSFTLLYYPNPEWNDAWDGETVFYDHKGEIATAVRPRPNRMILFDAGTLHAGRAPSRACPVLRVTVAYKLDRATSSAPVAEKVSASGSNHVHSIRFRAAVVDAAVAERLEKLSHSVSFPGFRPGHIPANVLQARYGAQSRRDVVNQMAGQAVERSLPKGSVASAVELKSGADSGDVELELTAVHLPDLPAIDFSGMVLERLTADDAALESSGSPREQAEAHFRGYLKAQVLDRLDSIYRFPILPSLIDQEFARIWKAAQAEVEIPADEKTETSKKFRAIAERRLRLGLVVAELARRNEIQAAHPAELEDKVIDHLVAQTQVEERAVSGAELREMLQS